MQHKHKDILANLKCISKQQNIFLQIVDDTAGHTGYFGKTEDFESSTLQVHLGFNEEFKQALEAARYLSVGERPTALKVREALVDADEDPEKAALIAYGLEPSEKNLKALKELIGTVFAKSEQLEIKKPNAIEPATVLDQAFAQALARAFDAKMVVPVTFKGKHTNGMFVAWDEEGSNRLLLKPGAGQQNPSAGMADENYTQTQREVAFYHLAETLELNRFLPEARMVYLDKKAYAVFQLLPWHYKKAQELKKQDPAGVARLFRLYQEHGELYQWAI
jgi:hypothetical protein